MSEVSTIEQGIRVAQPVAAGQSLQTMAWRQLWRKRTAFAGLGIIVVLVLTALPAGVLAPYDPTATGSGEPMLLPNWQHPLGTDMLGRDMLSRVIHGSRVAIYVGVLSLLLPIVAGIPLGVIAGFYGGIIDNVIMRLMDIMLAFPIFLLAIVVMVILEPSTTNVVIALGIVRIPIYARLVRGSVLSVKALAYIEAAKALAGLSNGKSKATAAPILLNYFSLLRLGRQKEAEVLLSAQTARFVGSSEDHILLVETQGRLFGGMSVPSTEEEEARALYFRALTWMAKGQASAAKTHFEAALKKADSDSIIAVAAQIELQRLSSKPK